VAYEVLLGEKYPAILCESLIYIQRPPIIEVRANILILKAILTVKPGAV
jgi:hypothetical protein